MTTDPEDAIRLIQSGLDKLGHAPGAIDGRWGVRTARALRQLIAANGRAASVAPQGPLTWITEAKTALGRNVVLSRIRAAPSARLGHMAFEGQGAFFLPMLNADGVGYKSR